MQPNPLDWSAVRTAIAAALATGLALPQSAHRCDAPVAASDTAAGKPGGACVRPIPPQLRNSPNAVRARGGAAGDPVTLVLDFKEAGEANSTDVNGNVVGTFDLTQYGFAAGDLDSVAAAVLATVLDDYLAIPALDVVANSPLPAGQALDIAVVIGNIGAPPSNGASEYYYVQIGSDVNGGGPLGQTLGSVVRDENGASSGVANASIVASIFTDNINDLTMLTPSSALTSGNLTYTRHALAGTTAHEIGHAVSLAHLNVAGSVTPTGRDPLMATGAIDLSNQQRIFDREFSISGTNSEAGGAAQNHIQQLIGALGLQPAVIWVDFAYTGPEAGTATRPFNTLVEGLAAVPFAGRVLMRAGSSSETGIFDQGATLDSAGGSVVIGG